MDSYYYFYKKSDPILLNDDNISIQSTGDTFNYNIPELDYQFQEENLNEIDKINFEIKEDLENYVNENIIEDRKDYILKSFKVKSSQYLNKLLNSNKEKIKFYKLNFKFFTQNINYNDNNNWFNEKIYFLILLQNKKNERAIKKIEEIKKKNPYSDNIKEINSILNLTYLDFLFKYYKEQFEKDFLNKKKYYEILRQSSSFISNRNETQHHQILKRMLLSASNNNIFNNSKKNDIFEDLNKKKNSVLNTNNTLTFSGYLTSRNSLNTSKINKKSKKDNNNTTNNNKIGNMKSNISSYKVKKELFNGKIKIITPKNKIPMGKSPKGNNIKGTKNKFKI